MNNTSEKYYFFWDGFCSQWAKSIFKKDGITYTSAEQYMMAQKALVFNDQEMYEAIMSTLNPRKQKAFGRQIANFTDDVWDKYKYDVVTEGTRLKFQQNPILLKQLFATYPKTIVEASPYDKVWGIGLEEGDERTLDESTWQGENLLGRILTEVRDEYII